MSWHKWWTPGRAPGASRRAFLGGAAAVITLPFLESLAPRAARAARSGKPPVRLVWVYVPNGMVMADFTPSSTGFGYDLPRILQPLAPVQDQVCVLTGLANRAASVPVAGDHARGTGSFLTCVTVEHTSDAGSIRNGVSIDQVAAQHIGDQTLFRSLELGTTGGPPVGDCDSGYSCAYSRNISWAGPTTPMAKLTDPRLVFDRLFAGFDTRLTEEQIARRDRWRTSVLDHAVEDATRLQARLSRTDRLKLDEYLTGVRELEQRIHSGSLGECIPGQQPEPGLPYAENIRAMNDVIVKALQCDLTRVVTFMYENAGSYRSFDFLGVPSAHHELSHHQNMHSKLEALVTIDTWEVAQLVHLIQGLQAVEEPDGSTLLDNTLVCFSSEISDGDRHNHNDLPVLLAGGGGGWLTPGRHIRYPTEQPIADLFLAMLAAAGVPLDAFGMDGTRPLDLS